MLLLLDLFRFCEGYDKYTRQHIAKFIYAHKESERFAKAAGMTHREFTSALSKEFCARCVTEGYLDCKGGFYWCKGKIKRPVMMKLMCIDGYNNRYTWEMMHIVEMSDEDLFSERRNVDRSERRIVRKAPAYERRI